MVGRALMATGAAVMGLTKRRGLKDHLHLDFLLLSRYHSGVKVEKGRDTVEDLDKG